MGAEVDRRTRSQRLVVACSSRSSDDDGDNREQRRVLFSLVLLSSASFHSACSSHTPHHISPEDEAVEGGSFQTRIFYLKVELTDHTGRNLPCHTTTTTTANNPLCQTFVPQHPQRRVLATQDCWESLRQVSVNCLASRSVRGGVIVAFYRRCSLMIKCFSWATHPILPSSPLPHQSKPSASAVTLREEQRARGEEGEDAACTRWGWCLFFVRPRAPSAP
ncbi:hypothetical protein C0Q70_02324 [Pomacea canaliculata]|uniref:Uncharacterized protein n=1 Tax=Pomacea canaliculata TaxID=400727 RepID=A0A2T7PPK7_POMCA|nr:hypothetical protein C0Q70_02324 [Pomacea canaliculata]